MPESGALRPADSELPMLCPHCCSPNRADEFACIGCGGTLIVARLIHPAPDGRTAVLPLRPRDYVIGFDGECDYYVPVPGSTGQAAGPLPVGNASVMLKHMNGAMFSAVFVPGKTVVVNERGITMDRMLQDGDRLTVGEHTLRFVVEKAKLRIHGKGGAPGGAASSLTRVLDTQIGVETAGFIRTGCALAVRFLMDVTGTDRGIFFRVKLEDEGGDVALALKPMYSWSVRKGTELKGDETLPISEAVVDALLTYDGRMVIVDGIRQSGPVAGGAQRTWVCLPIVVPKAQSGLDDCLAVIYVDNDLPQKPLSPDCERTLTAVAADLARHVERWRVWWVESDASRRLANNDPVGG